VNDKLCAHFIPRHSTALKLAYKMKRKDLNTVTDLKEWIEWVQLLDDECMQNKGLLAEDGDGATKDEQEEWKCRGDLTDDDRRK
jgi:hypothetical protein